MLVCLLIAGCVWITDGDHDDRMDLDGDGLQYDEDCDDNDAAIGAMGTWYADVDGDGYGDANASLEACEAPSDAVLDATDCDDSFVAIHPAADEVCDGVDNDCDELIDDDDDSVSNATDWYPDADGDGFGDSFGAPVQACDPLADHTGEDDATDCDDDDDSIYPDADEYCDGVDHDCDGEVNDDDAVDVGTWYLDGDGDEYGIDDDTTVACEQPSGYADVGGDCDDGDTAFNPGATEDDCSDPADYNCDGSTGYVDDDGDGYPACEECDDADASIYPDANEYCDGADNDCDGDIDEEPVDGSTWFMDGDGDGYGVPDTTMDACDQPSGYVAVDTDCDDADSGTSPDADELCNGYDDDCDGDVDEDDALDADTWFADADIDGYGDAAMSTTACDQPSGYLADATDCDDSDDYVFPGAFEYCDGVDNDCGGVTDGLSEITLGTNILWDASFDGCGASKGCGWGVYDRNSAGTDDPWAQEYSNWTTGSLFMERSTSGVQTTVFQDITSADTFNQYYVMEIGYVSYAAGDTTDAFTLGTGMSDWAGSCNICAITPNSSGLDSSDQCGPVYISAASVAACSEFSITVEPDLTGIVYLNHLQLLPCVGR